MQKMKQIFFEEKLVPVVRGNDFVEAQQIIDACKAAGFRIIEMTYTNPDVAAVIKTYAKDETIIVGAGTVTNLERAKNAIACGARFIVSPNFNLTVAEYCKAENVLYVPGCLTPTEVALALEHGIDFVKLFPGDAIDFNYIKALNGPLPEVKFMVTGGVNNENYLTWLKNGATCVGLGSSLTKNFAEITAIGTKLIEGLEK